MLLNWNEVLALVKPIKGIIHIGAHKAEERPEYLEAGIPKIIWIEANSELAAWLRDRVPDPVFQCAISDHDYGQQVLRISDNDGQSSSILEPKEHLKQHRNVKFPSRMLVPVMTLDTVLMEQWVDLVDYNFISMDIQGAELLALKGMRATLPYIDAIYTEVNFIEMYTGCGLIEEVDAFLAERSFTRKLLHDTGKGWGDALYVRS